ncbi:MAG: hypothetical protein LBU08_03510 [Tannerellaceae bacterium]|nr:hypothetical protein [Tannerellaceae bacterium]
MKTRRQYVTDFFLTSAKAAFAVLCLTTSSAAFLKLLDKDPTPSPALLVDFLLRFTPFLLFGLLFTALLFIIGYFSIKKHDADNL